MKKLAAIVVVIVFSAFTFQSHKPVLYIIGDSTVKNGDGTGKNGQWGWGTVIDSYFDTMRITVQNHAIGGRSSRTFITDGRWEKILETLTKGDYVIMQFGHNDAGALDDTARARGTIKGVGNDSVEIYNPIRKTREIVHSYGWYMRKYVNEAKAKGATAIICSPIPRNNFVNGKTVRSDYIAWAKNTAEETGAFFVDLHERIALQYDKTDTAKVSTYFFGDRTHTNKEGAVFNAAEVVGGIRDLTKCDLKNYLK